MQRSETSIPACSSAADDPRSSSAAELRGSLRAKGRSVSTLDAFDLDGLAPLHAPAAAAGALSTLETMLLEADAQLEESRRPPPLSIVQLEALLLDAAVQLGDADVLASLGVGGSPDSSQQRVGSQWLAHSAKQALAACLIQRVARGRSSRQLVGAMRAHTASSLMLTAGGGLGLEVAARASELPVARMSLEVAEAEPGSCCVSLEILPLMEDAPFVPLAGAAASALPPRPSVLGSSSSRACSRRR